MKKEYSYKISVIIVNYNVEFFLEQCLNSVKKALQHVKGEVFIVDNNSIDGSVEMVQKKFPEYNLIANKDNRGFSKANNQAILLSESEYVLLLNPDTVVEEDTFSSVVNFMDEHPKAGGLGVRMLDGKGKFLPESKRGLPTPAVAFFKIFGFSRIFPKSRRFGQYHLGYLSEFETNEVDILSGAFMLMRSEALDKVGLLDEAFFMYGEDIDLSYRIIKGGYQNYYFPKTRIIHYKGESTKKSSVNYVFVFYRAMIIFASKHFSQKNARLFSFLINAAIYFRAALAISARFIKRITLPLVDFSILTFGLFALTNYWRINEIEFPDYILKYALPLYCSTWMVSTFFNGGYDFPVRFQSFLKGSIIGTLLILVIYALLPKDWQFSRLYIVLGSSWVILYYFISRLFFHFSIGARFSLSPAKNKRFVIVGTNEEYGRITDILHHTNAKIDSIFHVSSGSEKESNAIGTINQLDQVVHIHDINEIIFSAQDNSAQEIIHWMSEIPSSKIDFKIAQPETLFLIGSNSIETAGDLYVFNINAISKPENQRAKRTFDLLISILLLLSSPLNIWFFGQPKKYFSNMIKVLLGKYSIVGYTDQAIKSTNGLPRLKNGILTPMDRLTFSEENISDKMNLLYARDYSLRKDLAILTYAWKRLDR